MIYNFISHITAWAVVRCWVERADAFSITSSYVAKISPSRLIPKDPRVHQNNEIGNHLPLQTCKLRSSTTPSVSEEMTNDSPENDIAAEKITINPKLIQEVEELRRKSRELMNEANTSENLLRQATLSSKQKKDAEIDDIIDKLVENNFTVVESSAEDNELNSRLVSRLRDLHLSETKLLAVIERIYKRETNIFRSLVSEKTDATVAMENEQRDIDSRSTWIDKIIAAQTTLDQEESSPRENSKRLASILLSRYRELKRVDAEVFQRQLNVANSKHDDFVFLRNPNSNNGSGNSTILIDIPSNATLTINFGGTEVTGSRTNMTRLLSEIVRLPPWFPAVFLPMVVQTQESLDVDDLKKIRSEILMGTRFKCTGWDSIRFAAIYRGEFVRLRSRLSARDSSVPVPKTEEEGEIILSQISFKHIQEKMEQAGLSEKIQLFLMDDPEWRPGNPAQLEPSSVIIALPRSVSPRQGRDGRVLQPIVSTLATVSTAFTTFAYSVSAYALNPTIFDAIVNKNDVSSLSACIPIFFGVLGLSVVHEIAHFITAKRLKMDIGAPIPLPSLQIGTFGSITPLRSFPESRTDLIDFALSGPLISFLVSLLCLIAGIYQTIHISSDLIPNLATVPVALFKSSLLVGSIVSFLAPKVMMLPVSQPIPIHPLFMIGLAGVVASALNLLPIGRLDGGRASTAIFGRRSSYLISILTLAVLALSALTGSSTTSIFWGLIVTVFQRVPDIPIRDEISEVDNVRFGLYIVSLVITVLVLLPFPGAISAI